MKCIKKQLSKQGLKQILFSIVLLLTSVLSFAQGPDGPPDVNPDAGVPLEGADILLLAMGLAFVAFKFWQYGRKNKAQTV